jgi:hypothetical protein
MGTNLRCAFAATLTNCQSVAPPDDALITSATARELAGGISTMTIWRWVRDGIIPEPTVIRGRNYWRRVEFVGALTAAGSAAATDRPAPQAQAVGSAA